MANATMSCQNTPKYLRGCCSSIGQNNTKTFSAQSEGGIARAVWKWFGKSRFPGAFCKSSTPFFLPDLFPPTPTNCPSVSEDGPVIDDEIRHKIVKVVCRSAQLSPGGSTATLTMP